MYRNPNDAVARRLSVVALTLVAVSACSDDGPTARSAAEAPPDSPPAAPADAPEEEPAARPERGSPERPVSIAVPDAGPPGRDAAPAEQTLPDGDLPDLTPPDMELPDIELPDIELPDTAPPDMDLPDMAPPDDRIAPGALCEGRGDCDSGWRCLDGRCRLDLRPEVFVVRDVDILQPAGTAQLLGTFLGDAIDDGQLNMIVEPGGYTEDDVYRWYVGNGGVRFGDYDYLYGHPVQNLFGVWRRDAAGEPVWSPDGPVVFQMLVPTGVVESDFGDLVNCYSTLRPVVELTLQHTFDARGLRLDAALSGYLTAREAESVAFRFNGAEIALAMLLDPDDLTVDSDGDGVADAYPFEMRVRAMPSFFIGDPPNERNRDPEPDPELLHDPACDR